MSKIPNVVDIKYSSIHDAVPMKLAPKSKYQEDDDDADSDADDDEVASYGEDEEGEEDDIGVEANAISMKKKGLQKGIPSKKVAKPPRNEDDDGSGGDDTDDDDMSSNYDSDNGSAKNDDDNDDDDDDDDDDDNADNADNDDEGDDNGGSKQSKNKRKHKDAEDGGASDDESASGGDDGGSSVAIDDDNDDDVQDDGEKYKKINYEFRKNYIVETHPEAESHTDDEIHSLATVVRNKVGIVVDPLHKTIPLLTKYEKTRILGIRTKQLNNGAQPYVSTTGLGSAQIIDGYVVALRELEEKRLPFIIRRPLPNGGTEYWYLQDLEVL